MDTLDLHFNAGDALAASQLNEMVDGINESLTELPKMAKKDGYYEQLGAGYAKSMLGTGASVPAELTRRTAGGTADIASGVASFKSIEGNTIVWNQLVASPIKTVTNTGFVSLGSISVIANHKYFFKNSCDRVSTDGNTDFQVYIKLDNIAYAYYLDNSMRIFSFNDNAQCEIILAAYSGMTSSITSTTTFIDLTQMFGAGNEPASVAEFEALFPNLYYPYNAGQLLSLTAQKFVTDGFNAFNVATGKAEVIGGLTPSAGQAGTYQITGAYTALSLDGETITPDTNGFFTPAKSGELSVTGGDDTTCVHLVWSGVRNGEFEPYWKSEKTLDLTTITGKLNGQGESVTIFPDGMRSAGTAHDELIRDTSGNIVQAVVKLGKRAYTSGDEDDATLVTDKTNTIYPLTTPQTYVLDEPLDPNYRVDDFGTEGIEPLTDAQGNPATAPFKAEIVYGPNVQDTIRRLPTNYLSIADYKTGIANLASAFGTSLGKTIAIAWGGDNGSVPTFTITDNPTE